MCDCDKMKNIGGNVADYFDYDYIGEDINTDAFTRYTDKFKIMCVKHHPFFTYLAGINHISPSVVSVEILHAWYSKGARELKILGKRRNDDVGVGLTKAWNLFWGDKDLITRTYNLGDEGESITEYVVNYDVDPVVRGNIFGGNIYVGLLCNEYNYSKQ
jgi:hypothetical protein